MARYTWALLLVRIDEVFPLTCLKCGGEIRIIAFIAETPRPPAKREAGLACRVASGSRLAGIDL